MFSMSKTNYEQTNFVYVLNIIITFNLMQSALVPTGETVRLRFFMDLLIRKRVPVMLVGGAGSGKSVIMADKLATLVDNYNIANVPFNYYTTSGE